VLQVISMHITKYYCPT